jgi:putative transposase
LLATASRGDLFLTILEETRLRYRFVVLAYVIMPEHFHLLVTEPEVGDPSVVMKVIKERFSRAVHRQASCDLIPERVWQKRFYDFNVWSERKRIEKLRYIHWNPVKRGLVERPEEWRWSSVRAYSYGESGAVRVNFQEWALEIKACPVETFGGSACGGNPLIRQVRE